MFARDYKIEVAADNKDCVFWKMIRKGEHVSPTDEDKEMAVATAINFPSLVTRRPYSFSVRSLDPAAPS